MFLAEPLTPAHAAVVFDHVSDPELYQYIPGAPPERLEALVQRYTRLAAGCPDGSQEWLNWVAFVGPEPVGTLQATVYPGGIADIGYVLFRAHWGKGLASRGCRWLLGELFDQRGARVVRAYIDQRNTASIHVAQAIGLRRLDIDSARDQSELPEIPLGEVPDGDVIYGLSLEEWVTRRADR